MSNPILHWRTESPGALLSWLGLLTRNTMSAKVQIFSPEKSKGLQPWTLFTATFFSIPLSDRCFQYPSLLLHVPRVHSLRVSLYSSLWCVTPASLSLTGVPRVPLSYLLFPGFLFLMTCSQNLSGGCYWHPSSEGVAKISLSLSLSFSFSSLIPESLTQTPIPRIPLSDYMFPASHMTCSQNPFP